jgi:lysophospholipase L1-like esterase
MNSGVTAQTRRWPRRLAGFAIFFTIYLVALEVFLQLVALFVTVTGREIEASWLTDDRRILCVGDSNTYGLYLEREDAYPQQLEALWNESVDSPKVEVLNLGFPGTNSSRILSEYAGLLETLRPDVVIILVGANDFWTVPVAVREPGQGSGGSALRELLLGFRTYQLAHILWREFNPPEFEVVFERDSHEGITEDTSCTSAMRWGDHEFGKRSECMGTARFGDSEFELGWKMAPSGASLDDARVADNLGALTEQAREFGATPILLTYPTALSYYGRSNGILRQSARTTGTELIDVFARFDPLCRGDGCPELLFPDGHPRSPGYRLMAELILEHLTAQ